MIEPYSSPIKTDVVLDFRLMKLVRGIRERLSEDKDLIGSSLSAGFTEHEGKVFQVFLSFKEYSPELLAEDPDTGGLLENRKAPKKNVATKRPKKEEAEVETVV
jgi:hypothetical protein